MASDIEICNRALVAIGQEPILTLDESSKESRRCKQLYPAARDTVLRAHPWSFALRRQYAAREDVSVPFGYQYKYALPTECLRLVNVLIDDSLYTLEGRSILTDEQRLEIIYVERITDPNKFDQGFEECLVLRLAADLCPSLLADYDLMKYYEQKYQAALASARHVDSTETSKPLQGEGTWITARF